VTSNNAMHVQTQSAASGEVSQPVMLSLPYLFQIYRKAVYLPFTNTSCGDYSHLWRRHFNWSFASVVQQQCQWLSS